MPTSQEFLKVLFPKVTNELIVTTPGRIASELYALGDREGNFYQLFMSSATAHAFGLAMALPHRHIVSLDGDGSILMGLTVLPSIANKNPSNLVIIVFDNQIYEMSSGDKIATFTAGQANLADIARGAGLKNARQVKTLAEFEEAVKQAFEGKGTAFIVAKVERPPAGAPAVRLPPYDTTENKFRFVRHVEKTENIEILARSKRVVK